MVVMCRQSADGLVRDHDSMNKSSLWTENLDCVPACLFMYKAGNGKLTSESESSCVPSTFSVPRPGAPWASGGELVFPRRLLLHSGHWRPYTTAAAAATIALPSNSTSLFLQLPPQSLPAPIVTVTTSATPESSLARPPGLPLKPCQHPPTSTPPSLKPQGEAPSVAQSPSPQIPHLLPEPSSSRHHPTDFRFPCSPPLQLYPHRPRLLPSHHCCRGARLLANPSLGIPPTTFPATVLRPPAPPCLRIVQTTWTSVQAPTSRDAAVRTSSFTRPPHRVPAKFRPPSRLSMPLLCSRESWPKDLKRNKMAGV